ncbi:sulfurase [Marinomonas ushuaiensis DSM 15871]|uniref:Sulfurase n=1 Tax=Marinomonas ushuaiensis DSM 15871 TaxID=1122207 RepID=X7E300_9GAMM|nr:MOSC domain-containing protein [Marinomonas ushuaiensis]ETX09553.1 sulfurase [Marinomonas ushuaiensis DSM 15871]
MTYSLSKLAIYPIKSIHGITLQTSQVNEAGLLNDRRYMLVTPDGECVTGREFPKLTLIKAEQLEDGAWLLSHPTLVTELTLSPKSLSGNYKNVVIWEESVQGEVALEEANIWFSSILAEPVELVYFSDKSVRFTSRKPDSPVAFADGYPFLLTTQASLNELNRTCPEDIKMAQFRPNLVIEGNKPFEEDSWKRIKIGEVEFENVKPCIRCIFTTLNPETAERLKKGEPLKTLGKFRLLDKKGITFGINMIALNTGIINVDDKVEILEYQEADTYNDRR